MADIEYFDFNPNNPNGDNNKIDVNEIEITESYNELLKNYCTAEDLNGIKNKLNEIITQLNNLTTTTASIDSFTEYKLAIGMIFPRLCNSMAVVITQLNL